MIRKELKYCPWLCIAITLIPLMLSGQDLAIGEWRAHLSLYDGMHITEGSDKVYVATKNGMYSIHKGERSVELLSTIDGFSGINADALRYNREHQSLIIGYKDAVFDILTSQNQISTNREINLVNEPGIKSINDFYFHEGKVYISLPFGIAVYDVEKDEFPATYKNIADSLGTKAIVQDVAILENHIYASTQKGIIRADLDDYFLESFEAWTNIQPGTTGEMINFNGYIYAAVDSQVLRFDGTAWEVFIDSVGVSRVNSIKINHDHLLIASTVGIYLLDRDDNLAFQKASGANDAILDEEGIIWYALDRFSVIRVKSNGKLQYIIPDGPYSPDVQNLTYADGEVWAMAGALTPAGNPTFNSNGAYAYINNNWESYNRYLTEGMDGAFDILDGAVDPAAGSTFLSSFRNGLFEIADGEVVNHYNRENSTLEFVASLGDTGQVRTAGLGFDSKNNLWVANNGATNALSVKTREDQWYAFNLNGVVRVTNLVIDHSDQVWLNIGPGNGILVYNHGNSLGDNSDDLVFQLDRSEGTGALPSLRVFSMAVDNDGELWIGTDDGVAIIYDPARVFSGGNFDAQQVFVRRGGQTGLLLANQNVTAIAVDGANRKWIGTGKGAYLVSPDGEEILQRFTVDNSPLFSNEINAITVDDETGEVYFGTSLGLISYKATAVEGGDKHSNVFVYPNPVRPEYEGPIAIRGLVRNANVKIADISGNMVYEMTADGGQAVWDGRNFSGREVSSGVYLVFSTNEDGTETFITKILIIR